MLVAMTGCASPGGATPSEKRADIQRMRDEALSTFHAENPGMREELAKAPGYGVFSGISTQTIFVASGNGFGVIHDNATGRDTYMKAFKLGGGLGAGVADIRAVVVFHDSKTMYDVMEKGWGVTGKGSAAAKVGDQGAAGDTVVTLPGMSIYRFTENGVLLGGAIEGAKVWKDDELN
jgi:lipid-binding SYLF domain-containing protein